MQLINTLAHPTLNGVKITGVANANFNNNEGVAMKVMFSIVTQQVAIFYDFDLQLTAAGRDGCQGE